MDSRAT